MKDGKFVVIRDIPLSKDGKSAIKKGNELYLTHGVFYLNGGMLPGDYQEDFRMLLSNEMKNGWKYLCPDD